MGVDGDDVIDDAGLFSVFGSRALKLILKLNVDSLVLLVVVLTKEFLNLGNGDIKRNVDNMVAISPYGLILTKIANLLSGLLM